MRVYSKTGLQFTESKEGLQLVAYQDGGGVWTIGYGHTLRVKAGDTCTAMQAVLWLMEDLRTAEAAVNQLVIVELSQGQFDALVDFVFNIGASSFSRSTILQLLNLENYEGAANEFEKWCHVNGQKCEGLLRRRREEENFFTEKNA